MFSRWYVRQWNETLSHAFGKIFFHKYSLWQWSHAVTAGHMFCQPERDFCNSWMTRVYFLCCSSCFRGSIHFLIFFSFSKLWSMGATLERGGAGKTFFGWGTPTFVVPWLLSYLHPPQLEVQSSSAEAPQRLGFHKHPRCLHLLWRWLRDKGSNSSSGSCDAFFFPLHMSGQPVTKISHGAICHMNAFKPSAWVFLKATLDRDEYGGQTAFCPN